MITHLLDTSAILAHYFNEAGADEVDHLWRDSANAIGLSVLTLVELHGRLDAAITNASERERVFRLYAGELAAIIEVDHAVAQRACGLRAAARSRLPLVDAVIAATASVHNATLVHRDPHFAAVDGGDLAQLVLPGKP